MHAERARLEHLSPVEIRLFVALVVHGAPVDVVVSWARGPRGLARLLRDHLHPTVISALERMSVMRTAFDDQALDEFLSPVGERDRDLVRQALLFPGWGRLDATLPPRPRVRR
jgi:hypothetical protein